MSILQGLKSCFAWNIFLFLVSFRPRNGHGAGDGHGDAAADSHVSMGKNIECLDNQSPTWTNINRV